MDLLALNRPEVLGLHPYDFNCGGFALGTFDWFAPYSYDVLAYPDHEEGVDPDDAFESMVEDIEIAFPFLLQVNSYRHVPKRFNVIGFRLERQDSWNEEDQIGDFHFILRYRGKWYHKAGGNEIDYFPTTDLQGQMWCGRYDSDIAWFVDKRDIFQQVFDEAPKEISLEERDEGWFGFDIDTW